MLRKFSRWLNSKEGKRILLGVVALVVVLALVGTLTGWWDMLANLISGTAGPAAPTYPAPQQGYTCFPTCDETDGKFLVISNQGQRSFTGEKVVLWIGVPGDQTSLSLSVFDGDSGKDANGAVNWRSGHWDDTETQAIYTLFADPLKDGKGDLAVGTWSGNDVMLDNAWYDIVIDTTPEARAPSGHYFYRLEVTQPVGDLSGANLFKIRSSGYLSIGQADGVDASFGISGGLANINDLWILHPQSSQDIRNLGPSNYSGEWEFHFYVPSEIRVLELWDGDFDRGPVDNSEQLDSDDPNTVGKPEWASSYAVDERAGDVGAPPDDAPNRLYRRSPAVQYQLIDPDGTPLYINDNPSGTEEWEKYIISSDSSVEADEYVDNPLKAGFYTLYIQGLDLHNFIWYRFNFELVPPGELPPPVCDATCPRTIGYWKNNVKKNLEGKTNGIQETTETIEAALRVIALRSPLFRHGIDVTNPQPLPEDAGPLTLEEANMILQRKKNNYPGDANSMLARALQQNLATWLNWGSGKICDFTVVELNVAGGTFSGTVEEALAEAQTIILNHDDANMERAKDIADQINNGLLGEDAETSTCEDYTAQIPPDRQPPKYEEMPVAPTPEEPEDYVPEPQPDPATCEGVRTNTYNVESPTNNPFYGIKFEYQSGTEVKNGNFEEFKVTLPADVVANMTSVQLEAKAGQNVGIVTLEGCDFTSPLPCGGEPITDENNYFAFYFMGAEDNGDGTYTLTYHVQNMTDSGLSHATIGLPEGVVPSQPSGNYQSEVCP